MYDWLVERACGVCFWLGALAVALGLILPLNGAVESLLVSTFDLDWTRSRVPVLLAALCWSYPATLLALAVLVGAVVMRRVRGATAHVRSVALPTFLLPTYVAGLESLELLTSPLCPISRSSLVYAIVTRAIVTGCALLFAIVLGGLGARAWGHHSRMGLPVPPAAGAVAASLALQWWIVWKVLTTYPGP